MADKYDEYMDTLPRKHPNAQFKFLDPKRRGESQRDKAARESRNAGRHAPEAQGQAKGQEDDSLSAEKWADLVGALRLHRRRLLRVPGVTGVDIGYRFDDDTQRFTDEVVLRVHVERKQPLEYFKDHPSELICKSSKKPDSPELAVLWEKLEGQKLKYPNRDDLVTLNVIPAKYRPAALSQLPSRGAVLETPRTLNEIDRRRRLDPLVGGISIGSPSAPVGTLGALVWDKTDGTICILSNWHVLAGDLHAEVDSPCFQPGHFDQGRSSDVVARLKRWSFDNETDAAIAELTGNRHYCAGEILDLYQQITGVQDPYLGMVVLKSGRSSGVTWGFVDGLYFSTVIEYSNGVVREFEDQIHIAPLPPKDPLEPVFPISGPGDSGSVWVTKSNGSGYRAVGLHFAGDLPRSAFGEYALANPMRVVKERLNFSFRPRFLEIRDQEPASMAAPETQSVRIQRGNGIQPMRVIVDGLSGPGGQPDPIEVPPR
jgi:hypothetical protein